MMAEVWGLIAGLKAFRQCPVDKDQGLLHETTSSFSRVSGPLNDWKIHLVATKATCAGGKRSDVPNTNTWCLVASYAHLRHQKR